MNRNDPSGLYDFIALTPGGTFNYSSVHVTADYWATAYVSSNYLYDWQLWQHTFRDWFYMEWEQYYVGGGTPAPAEPSVLKVRNLSKSGNNQIFIENSLRWISAALSDDPDCSSWLEGAQGYIDALLGNSMVAHGEFESRFAAFTGTEGSDVPKGYAAMVVNDSGAFFKGGFTLANGTINGGTDLARAFILLHELAHGLEIKGFENDFGDSAAGARNDAKVLQNCDKTLGRLR